MLLKKMCKVESYTFSEFRLLTESEYSFIDRAIDHIKRNKKIYTRLVVVTAMLLNHNMIIFADTGASLDATFGQLIGMLMQFAKWGCLGLGLKKTIEEMLSGANFKQASTSGIQYWLAYIFIQFYPRLFDLIKL